MHLLLEAVGITKEFPGTRALDNVRLELYAGEVHAVMGENGAGKSTLMKILAGINTADQGEILFENRLVRPTTPREALMLGIAIVLIAALLQAATGRFITTPNLNATSLGFATSAIMVFGMTSALVSGGFDLSVGSVFAMGGVVTALALRAGLPVLLGIACGVGSGLLAGLMNGLLISKAGINPFITTLGMMGIARGVALAVTEGTPLANLPASFLVYGQGRTLDVPNLILIALITILIGDVLMRRSSLFRQVYYVGGNEEAARLSGINTSGVKIWVYAMSGMFAGLAGVLSVSRFTVADPGTGTGEELRIIAACIIGGCSLRGGKGTVIGGLLGLIFVGFINNGMVLLRVPVYWQQLVMGVVLLLAVGFDTFSQRWQARARGKSPS